MVFLERYIRGSDYRIHGFFRMIYADHFMGF